MLKESGIYSITNTTNGYRYIGSSVNLRKRLREHRIDLHRNQHPNRHLQRAWTKYGEAAFSFDVIEIVNDVTQLHDREQHHLNAAHPLVFNVGRIAAHPMLGVSQSAETRAKIGAKNKGLPRTEAQKAFLRTIGIGRTHSAETKAKMSAAHKGSKCPRSPEHAEKLRQALLGRTLSPEHRAAVARANTGRKHSPEWIARAAAHNYGNHYRLGKRQTHCRKGHELTPDNVYTSVQKKGYTAYHCRICAKARAKHHRLQRIEFGSM
jgi:group I intron endonuclease